MRDILDDVLGPAQEKPKAYTMSADERRAFMDDFHNDLNADMGAFERFLVGTGRGFNTIANSVGLGTPESPNAKRGLDALTDESLAAAGGELLGEVAPFLPAGLAAGSKFLANKLLLRILYSSTVGAAEGAAIARGKGGDSETTLNAAGVGGLVAGGLEAIFPVIGRLGRSVYQRLGRTPKGPLINEAGEPTAEFTIALKDAGITWDDFTDDAVDFVIRNQDQITDPSALGRKARFDKQGVRYTLGDITQDFTQQAREQQALSSTMADGADPLRLLKAGQSGDFERAATNLAGEFGDATDAGRSVKSALEQQKQLLRAQKARAYRKARNDFPELADIPLDTSGILSALPDRATLRRLGRLEGSQVKALSDLLVEFGIDKSDEAVEAFIKSGDEITPLSMGNFEDFRVALNQVLGADRTGAASVAAGPVKGALDSVVDAAIDQLPDSADEMVSLLRQGRGLTKDIATNFSPKAQAGRLIDLKGDKYTPVIEASKVVQDFYSQPVEQVGKTLSLLHKSGKRGRAAIGNMRASVVLNALEDALKAPSRKADGVELVGGNQFAKSIAKFGDDKLELLFRGDKAGLDSLRQLVQTGLDMQPTGGAIPKGSAPINYDIVARIIGKFSKIPVLGEVAGIAKLAHGQRGEAQALDAAMKATPELKRVAGFLEAQFPAVAAVLGVGAITGEREDIE